MERVFEQEKTETLVRLHSVLVLPWVLLEKFALLLILKTGKLVADGFWFRADRLAYLFGFRIDVGEKKQNLFIISLSRAVTVDCQ